MSRIGRQPISLPKGVQVKIDGQHVTVNGPKGEIHREFDLRIGITLQDDQLLVTRSSDEGVVRALHGLTRALLANMVEGVTTGFRRSLEVVGVGYRADLQGNDLVLQGRYSHPVRITPPKGIKIVVEQGNRIIHVEGADKELVGKVAGEIRTAYRPEPYKGKGVRYLGESVRRKAGKAGKVTAGAA